MNATSSRSGAKLSPLLSSRRKILDSRYTTCRALSGLVRISDETVFSVLNRKCGLIWVASAASRACTSSRSLASSSRSLRALFQIFKGTETVNIVVMHTAPTVARSDCFWYSVKTSFLSKPCRQR